MSDTELAGDDVPRLEGRNEAVAPLESPDPRTEPTPRGLGAWVESRSGLATLLQKTFNPQVPLMARWRYALGASLVASLFVEFVTGILLMLTYSPSAATAWGSTFYIDQVQSFGWLLRGLHNYVAHAMIIVSALHLASVVVAGVYRAPREINWWLGLGMLGLLIAFTLTGNALVWDQDGYWAWHVETGIAGGVPLIGPMLQRVIVGGPEMGSATVSRLYALHVSILPILVLAMLAAHVILSRRHAQTRIQVADVESAPAWPAQVFINLLVSALVLGGAAALVVSQGGVALEAPADPASGYSARPAWFFFWLFELRKSFHGSREIIATMVIPGALTTVMLLLPFFDRILPRKLAHFLACSFTFSILIVAGYLTLASIRADATDVEHQASHVEARAAAARAVALAREGIPPEGAAMILGRDPLWHGRAVLQAKCLSCHVFDGKGTGEQTAADLKDFGSRAWLRGLLEKPDAPAYFGKVPACDGMVEWKKSSKLTPKQLDDVTDFVASFARIPTDVTAEEWLNQPGVAEHPGVEPFQKECGTCHVVEGLSEGGTRDAPKLFAYGSPQWIARMIQKPAAPDMYGYLENEDRMPAFGDQLTANDLQAIVRYLRNDYPGATGPKPAPAVEPSATPPAQPASKPAPAK
ncbi:MAG: cytochrome b N-terminal domain-containing protein [Isosphaeraceae bacterium]